MTDIKYSYEQKRLDNVQWSSVSRLSSLPSLPNDGKSPPLKIPLFYLTSVSLNDYEDDIYFVNNTDQTLHFVAPFNLYRNISDAGVKLGDITANNVNRAKLYADDMERLYTNVLPNQGVRIGSTHIMYDSDEMVQWFIHVPFKGIANNNSHYGIWCFNVVEKGGIGQKYPLLWDDFGKPSHMVSCEVMSEQDNMPIDPLVYEERCWVFDNLIESLGVDDAIFVLGINDVLYRYCVGWSAPYNESDIQATDIAHKLQELKPNGAKTIQDIIQTVYDFWFGKGFAKNIPMQACVEIFNLYQAQRTANKSTL